MQDTSESSAHQESMGGGFSASMGGASGSFSYSRDNASGNYAGVVEQSGIQAGAGGFDVDVKGNTDLKGAYIASTADPSKNQLTTGTLTYSDIQNHSDYSANSFGFGGGGTFGNGGANERTTGPSSGKNTGGIAPMLPQSESGSERGVTRSGVSEGTITLTNGANQTQDLASLNRDTSNLNETVNRTPDLQNLLNDQSRLMAAATAAGEAVARDIGTYADKKREAALKMADATTDPELKAQYQKEADDWKEGGDYRAAMHAAGGAIIAGLGGGNALGGALGAGLTSKLGGTLNELSENIQKAHPTGNADIDQALAQIVATGVGTAVGAAVGGGSGAFAGYNVDRFNRQLHEDKDPRKDERKRIQQDIAPQFAAAHPGMTVEQATQILADQLLRQVDTTAAAKGGWNQDAANYLSNYAAAHAGETVGKDQWGNAVPLFGTAAGYQRNDSTIFSANPQTTVSPPTLGLGSLGGYFKGVGQGLVDTLGHPIDSVWGSLKGVYTIITDPTGMASRWQNEARNVVIQAGDGNFGPAGQQAGQQFGTTLIDSVTVAGGGVLIGKMMPGLKDSRAAAGNADAAVSNNFYRDGISYDVRRIAYEADSRGLSNTVDAMRASGASEEIIARWAVDGAAPRI